MNPPVTFISGDRRLPELVGDVIAMFVPVLSLLCYRRSIIESGGDADHRQAQRPACRPAEAFRRNRDHARDGRERASTHQRRGRHPHRLGGAARGCL